MWLRGLALAAMVGLGSWLLLGAPAERPAPRARDVGAQAASGTAPAQAPPAPPAAVGPEAPAAQALPGALAGLTPSGALRVDAAGHFAPDADALLFFEFFLSASNELEPDALRALLARALRTRLAPPADAEALAFLDSYLAYREAAAAELSDPRLATSAGLERRLQWVRELRREVFGPALAESLFAEEEAAVRVQLEAQRIREDSTLSPQERRERLAALEARYPEPVRSARARAAAPLALRAEEARLREAGAGEAEIHALRVERVGPEAAERLRAADARRARWQARLRAYRAELAERLAGVDDPAERQTQARALRARHFDAAEQRRVAILDRQAAALQPGEPGVATGAVQPAPTP